MKKTIFILLFAWAFTLSSFAQVEQRLEERSKESLKERMLNAAVWVIPTVVVYSSALCAFSPRFRQAFRGTLQDLKILGRGNGGVPAVAALPDLSPATLPDTLRDAPPARTLVGDATLCVLAAVAAAAPEVTPAQEVVSARPPNELATGTEHTSVATQFSRPALTRSSSSVPTSLFTSAGSHLRKRAPLVRTVSNSPALRAGLALSALGISWDDKLDAQWQEHFKDIATDLNPSESDKAKRQVLVHLAALESRQLAQIATYQQFWSFIIGMRLDQQGVDVIRLLDAEQLQHVMQSISFGVEERDLPTRISALVLAIPRYQVRSDPNWIAKLRSLMIARDSSRQELATFKARINEALWTLAFSHAEDGTKDRTTLMKDLRK